LKLQDSDPKSRWRGGMADEYGLHYVAAAGSFIDTLLSSFLHPQSRFHNDASVLPRVKLAADLLMRESSTDGYIDNPITNFNSPPDTSFLIRALCPTAILLKRAGRSDILALVEPYLRKAGAGLVKGGIHTPNHRWVLCAALAQLNELFPQPEYVRRVDQWMAEGIDIDPDGQYTERSTYTYNPITDNALVTIAAKLNRPELLGPVRRNLESMLYLLHPGYEVVTEISRRQDLNQRGDMGGYWFALAYIAAHMDDGRLASIASHFAPTRASLSALMEYPELADPGPSPKPIPENYRKTFPHNGVIRVRRGSMSATVITEGRNRFFTLRNGDAVINAVRFASAFFGKAQFVPAESSDRGGVIHLVQRLSAPYYQPLEPPRVVTADDWGAVRPLRKQTELCKLEQSATITETAKGFKLRLRAEGTRDVPVAIEINFREGGSFTGLVPAHKVVDGWALQSGYGTYTLGSYGIRFGPALDNHKFLQFRGAEPKLGGPSVYLTAFTPLDYTLEFECFQA
jgi:hypothetical protein